MTNSGIITRITAILIAALVILTILVAKPRANPISIPSSVTSWCLNVFWKDGTMWWRPGVMGGPCRYSKHEVDV